MKTLIIVKYYEQMPFLSARAHRIIRTLDALLHSQLRRVSPRHSLSLCAASAPTHPSIAQKASLRDLSLPLFFSPFHNALSHPHAGVSG